MRGAGKGASGRRTFVKGVGGLIAATFAPGTAGAEGSGALPRAASAGGGGVPPRPVTQAEGGEALELTPVATAHAGRSRRWLGPALWANRLQDWRLQDGRLECMAGGPDDLGRTVAVLTRWVTGTGRVAELRARTGTLESSGRGGFSGFLVGVGAGSLDHRAAALAQKASGEAGGFWCGYESDGHVRFREHTDERSPFAFAVLPADADAGALQPPPRRHTAEDVELVLRIARQEDGRFTVTLRAVDAGSGDTLSVASRGGLDEREIRGGVALASSRHPQDGFARFWFSDVRAGGDLLGVDETRAFGPIAGALYSLDRSVLKLSAQLLPVGDDEPQDVTLAFRSPAGTWTEPRVSRLEPGFTASFRIDGWDASREQEYRLAYTDGAGETSTFDGRIAADPAGPFAIAHLSCVMPVSRSFDSVAPQPELPVADTLGRYTPANIYFPHARLVRHVARHDPSLLVFAGDQIYEHSPTRTDRSDTPTLDYLYKWYLWVWGFRDLTRRIPAILQTDDHDVYQGNLWGNGGRPAPPKVIAVDGRAIEQPDENRGGYRCSPAFVNLVERTQCSHNPDPFDPSPVAQDIGVYFASFTFGGIGFAILEDRKFKTAPIQGADLDVHEAELLGPRQEAFLAEWARRGDADARIALTQTTFACVQTSPSGRPLMDWDSNGQPKLQRDRAIALLRDARALVLAGDQHLASLVRHGIDTHTDGVVQYTGPAAVSFWQRWFEPADPLPNARGPHTGDFKDAFGNKVRVLAVANPRIGFAYYRRFNQGRSQALGDRGLKREGYGIVRVDRRARAFVIECWPWDVDPAAPGARQFDGWPYRLSFDELAGGA